MSKARILIVEDDFDIANLLRIYFTGQGYEVHLASSGCDAIAMTRQILPNLIVLDIILPDLDGFSICTELRTHSRTSHIPIIFLTQKDARSDRIVGLGLGADDYITKPFDIEELKLRVQNSICRSKHERLTDSRTGLPSGRLIEERLRWATHQPGWALMDIRICHFEPFRERYGIAAGDDLLHFTSQLIDRTLSNLGRTKDFLGHVCGGNFIVITEEEATRDLHDRLKASFTQETLAFYSAADRARGQIVLPSSNGSPEHVPLMTLAIGIVFSTSQHFTDIRQITELAAEARRQDAFSDLAFAAASLQS